MASVKNKEYLFLLDGGDVKIDSIKAVAVYKASLSERLVEQNSVTNYLLMNDLSYQQDVGLRASGYSHQLYLFVFYVVPEDKIIAIYLSTSYNVRGKCIGLGPAYIGDITDGDIEGNIFQARYELKVSKNNNRFFFSLPKKPVDASGYFYTDVNLAPDSADLFKGKPFFIDKIIQGADNKISGHSKRLVFHTEEIFKDKRFLAFCLDTVITK